MPRRCGSAEQLWRSWQVGRDLGGRPGPALSGNQQALLLAQSKRLQKTRDLGEGPGQPTARRIVATCDARPDREPSDCRIYLLRLGQPPPPILQALRSIHSRRREPHAVAVEPDSGRL